MIGVGDSSQSAPGWCEELSESAPAPAAPPGTPPPPGNTPSLTGALT